MILQASRKLPRAINELLARNQLAAADIEAFLLHQANLNLIARVATTLKVPSQRFFRKHRPLRKHLLRFTADRRR